MGFFSFPLQINTHTYNNQSQIVSIAYNPKIITDGLILYMDAGNVKSYPGTGTTIIDLSASRTNLTVYQSTYSNGYFEFDGVDDNLYISALSTNAPLIRGLTNTYTEEVIFYPLSTGGDDPAALIRSGLGIDLNFSFFHDRANRRIYMHWYDTTFQATYSSSSVTTLDKWNIGTIVRSGSSISFYINGVFINTNTGITDPTQLPSDIGIGAARAGTSVGTTGQDFAGRISSVKIYNRALTETEVKQNFNALRGRFGL